MWGRRGGCCEAAELEAAEGAAKEIPGRKKKVFWELKGRIDGGGNYGMTQCPLEE